MRVSTRDGLLSQPAATASEQRAARGRTPTQLRRPESAMPLEAARLWPFRGAASCADLALASHVLGEGRSRPRPWGPHGSLGLLPRPCRAEKCSTAHSLRAVRGYVTRSGRCPALTRTRGARGRHGGSRRRDAEHAAAVLCAAGVVWLRIFAGCFEHARARAFGLAHALTREVADPADPRHSIGWPCRPGSVHVRWPARRSRR